ncbi:MAG TPA: DUF5916 domain-containing protein [Bacteroidales bacterium]|nr:DUF5916 domain-containing protein [Bacteroidales bacterium]
MHPPAAKWLLLISLLFILTVTSGYSANSMVHDTIYSRNEQNGKQDSTIRLKRIYNTRRITEAPVIDGRLNDSCWKEGEWQSNYTQFVPTYRGKSSEKTEIKIFYNDKNIFVGIRAYDDMKKMTRRLSRRDNISGDVVGVHFDSYFDHRTAFEFDITSAGQKMDLWVANDGWDENWNAVWYGKVAYEDSSWTAEMEIPLSQLRYSSSPDQVWGLNSWRFIDRLQEEDHWNLVANDGTGIVYTYGELHGLSGMKKTRRVELVPYLSGKLTTDKKIPGNPFAKGRVWEGQGGLDAKIGITNNFTIDATINPDFGQVEADPSVMNLSAFETYFEEKRPFFVEGKSIFDFTFDEDKLFYTRRIGHSPSYSPPFDTVRIPEFTTIGGAFKLSGKTSGGLSLGLIESVTMKETADIHEDNDNSTQVVEPLSNYFIGRFQQDFNNGNTILGGIVTQAHRVIKNDYLNFLSRDALTYGLDFTKYWSDRKYFFEVKAVGSNVYGDKEAITRLQSSSARYYQRPGIKGITLDTARTSLNGFGASFKLGKWSKGHWRYNEELVMRSPGLEMNDLGYMNISDIQKNNTSISYVEKENSRLFKSYELSLLQQNAWNAHGDGLYSLFELNAESEFMNNWETGFNSEYKFRTVDVSLLRGGPSMKVPDIFEYSIWFHSNSSKKFFFFLECEQAKGLSGINKMFSIYSEIRWRPWSNLVVSLEPSFEKTVDDLQYIGQFENSSSEEVYLLGRVDNRNLNLTFRADLSLTPELTIQYYGSPFISIGKYSGFKKVVNPLDHNYENRYTVMEPQKNGTTYSFDDDNNGTADFSFTDPDFNFQQFKSNLVLRWEYRAGSTLYLVWAQDRTAFEQAGPFDFKKGYKNMADIFPKNIFMIKFNYWFSY